MEIDSGPMSVQEMGLPTQLHLAQSSVPRTVRQKVPRTESMKVLLLVK